MFLQRPLRRGIALPTVKSDKPTREYKVGDRIKISLNNRILEVTIKAIVEKRPVVCVLK
jgi:ribosomal 50S subunit-recycling heat shock protein